MGVNLVRCFRAVLLVSLMTAPSAYAGNSDEWQFVVQPYMWLSGQKGKVATLPPAGPAEIDVPFEDVFNSLDALPLMGYAAAHKGRFGVFAEIFYVGVSIDADTPGPFFSGADYEQDVWGLSLGGSYDLVRNKDYQVNAVAGVRFWGLDNKLELAPGLLAGREISAKETWQDFFIGARGKMNINSKWYVSGWAMAAIAGDSDSYLDVFGGVGYNYSDSVALSAGYRHQAVDYDNGLFLYDVELSGPALGLSYRF